MKKTIWILLAIIIFISCSEDEGPPYYGFTSEDFQYIPTDYEDVQILRFKNETGQELIFEVLGYSFVEFRSWGGPIRESLTIGIRLLNENDCDSAATFSVFYIKNPDNLLYMESQHCGFKNMQITSPSKSENLQTMEFNGVVYDKVMILSPNYSAPLFAYQDSGSYWGLKIYYDLKKGFIGFSERNDVNNYRLVSD